MLGRGKAEDEVEEEGTSRSKNNRRRSRSRGWIRRARAREGYRQGQGHTAISHVVDDFSHAGCSMGSRWRGIKEEDMNDIGMTYQLHFDLL